MSYDRILIKQMCSAGVKELQASHVITPGSLVERNSQNLLQPCSKDGRSAAPMFALPKEGFTIWDNYSVGDIVRYKICRAGDEVYGFLAADEAVLIGDELTTAGNGVLRKKSESDLAVAICLEQVSATEDSRFLIEII